MSWQYTRRYTVSGLDAKRYMALLHRGITSLSLITTYSELATIWHPSCPSGQSPVSFSTVHTTPQQRTNQLDQHTFSIRGAHPTQLPQYKGAMASGNTQWKHLMEKELWSSRILSVRGVLVIATIHGWNVIQLDVQTAFLQRE